MSWLHIFAHDIFIFFGGFEKLGCSDIFVTRTPIKYIMLSKVSAYFPCQMCHTIYFNSIHTCSYVQKTFSTFGAHIFRIDTQLTREEQPDEHCNYCNTLSRDGKDNY